ncbi:MAG TPA: hypothetical protein VHF01_01935 [Candidatus Acidoferrum sp.]|nr:hypothetical protein [Candidatus Acidoferrum sp.]
MKIERPLRLIGIALVGLAMLTLPLPAFSQNCALCYTQAASAGARMIEALRSGILVLIVPPMFMWVGVTVIAYRKRNQFKQVDYTPESDRNL